MYKLIKTGSSTKTRQELWNGLRHIDYFGAPVLSMGEVIEDEHIKERKAFIDRNHPIAGPTKLLGAMDSHVEDADEHPHDAPLLGQHTDEVLGNVLGLSAAQLSELRAATSSNSEVIPAEDKFLLTTKDTSCGVRILRLRALRVSFEIHV